MTNTTTPAARTYHVPTDALAAVTAAVAKVAARAAKIARRGALADVEPIALEVVRHYEERDDDGRVRLLTEVRVTGRAPRLTGWRFAARIEHVGGEGNLVKADPRVEGLDLSRFWTGESACDHCRTRRARRDTYVVAHDDGRIAQVGSSCLGEFLGEEGPDAALLSELYVEACGACEEGELGGGFGGGRPRATLIEYLSVVCAEARLHGWISRGKAREATPPLMATADVAWRALFPLTSADEKVGRELVAAVTDADRAFARGAVEVAREIEARSDYEHNLRVIASVPVIDARMAGLAASIYVWRRRALDLEIERQSRRPSEHRGAVGARLDVEVTCVRVTSWDSQWGTTRLHTFHTAEGDVLTWKTGSARLEEGQAYTLRATVKAHGEFKGTRQTEVTRPGVVELVGPIRCGDIAVEKPARRPRARKAAAVAAE